MNEIKSVIKSGIIPGLTAAWPICLGYIPIGLAFGVLAQKAGLHPLEIGAMSLLVFAGSSQFIAISMLSNGTGTIPIIAGVLAIILSLIVPSNLHILLASIMAAVLGVVFARRIK